MQHSPAEISRIISADYKLNHVGREYNCTKVKKLIKAWIKAGGFTFCATNVMFTGQRFRIDCFEFHSINGGSATDLSAGVNTLLNFLSGQYEKAVTYFDNPRVISLLKHADYPVVLEKIDEGQDRTYSATFILRS